MSRYLCLLVLLFINASVLAENWPCWRGPRGDGTSAETQIPVKWNGETGEGVAWKVAIPGKGHSSPIVWEDRVFVTTCVEESRERLLLCLNRDDGKILWQTAVAVSPLEKKHALNSFASGTPATDGELVYVTFLVSGNRDEEAKAAKLEASATAATLLVVAYNINGEKVWSAEPGGFASVHGFCSSPVIYKDLLIVNGDHDGDSYVAALNRKTGETVWRIPREHKTRSYCTPLIRNINSKDQMVMTGSKRIVSLDPNTGETNWLIEGPTEQFVSSMVFDGAAFYMTAGFPTHHVMSIRPDGTGDVTKSHVVWHSEVARCYVPSPVLVENKLFVADDQGTVNCFDTATGDRLWKDRLGNHYSGSLVTANGLAYFPADDGIVAIVKPDSKLDVVEKNKLGEYSYASPAISSGHIFIRGESHLFSIGAATTASR
jgi:outer membrane protein assembly factor BamB